jgi:hypothetical protein
LDWQTVPTEARYDVNNYARLPYGYSTGILFPSFYEKNVLEAPETKYCIVE